MTLDQLKSLFEQAGVKKLYAKPLAENDNSKNQIYFAGAVETLNVFPSQQIFAENTPRGPSFKAHLNFGWLLETGETAPAPGAQLILYSQYPEVRFSGFLRGCKGGPNQLMVDRERAKAGPPELIRQLAGRILFLGVTADRRVLGYVAAGNSQVALEFNAQSFPSAFVVFREVPLPNVPKEADSRSKLLAELGRINRLGWIDSKQLDSDGRMKPCNAPQCGGFTLEAELGVPKNSDAEPDFLGWEVKQHAVASFERVAAGTITLMTPEPTGGFYKERGPEAFVRRFGYVDKLGRPDRLNFGGIHKAGQRHQTTGLTLKLQGYNVERGVITDAEGALALVSDAGEVAAAWAFGGLLTHWARKHARAVYVPSQCRKEPRRQYAYGDHVRLAVGTDALRFLHAMADGAVYYDPGIKLEHASGKVAIKRRSQFRVASKNIEALYEKVELVEV
ncbi:MAG: MvaI/BcnI restriction endonuclease family protein [Verrucomicrobia bacterium]|nr:MvaI/BcnI restriction endonuclease family protein [Verrucomicrobiota bacterium]